ncbi:MAG: PhzF family phenazine biosynthesis protein [Candidatus Melainabacteria bacterium]|nr:PhzF family phenazine biosynthesis protein [Candidatus Melainabacteria bacterium]MBI3309542.1 PhzF family phenazine biosynthesis protein [Candidatus Melainabacteria bacterium]
MEFPLFQVDAFTDKPFHGNPAAVVILDKWLSDDILQNIAAENNLSETSFVQINQDGLFIRWFTPVCEVELCGHATLAAAYIVFEKLISSSNQIKFHTKYSGDLLVAKTGNWYQMEFPALPFAKIAEPEGLIPSLGIKPSLIYKSKYDLLLVYDLEKQIREITPDFGKLSQINTRGIIITAEASSNETDFVSRYFAPKVGVNEDPVTGSAHSVLIPYWSIRLNKQEMIAKQISKRGGTIKCAMKKDKVIISGQAVCVLEGTLSL